MPLAVLPADFTIKRGDFMPRKSFTDEEIAKRKNQILEVSLSLFEKKGYDGTTMRQIAQQAGMSLGMLYYYFENKTDIYLELYGKALDLLEASFRTAMETPVPDIPSRISIMLYSYFNFYNDHPDYYRIFTYGNRGGDTEIEIPRELKEKGLNLLHLLETPVQEGMKQGVIRPSDSFKAVVSMWSMSDGILMLHKKTRVELLGDKFMDYYATAVNIILNGILTGGE